MYCWRSSSASANRNGSSPCAQNSAIVQYSGRTPVVRAPVAGVPFGSPLRGGARTRTDRNGAASRPSGRSERAASSSSLVLAWSRNSRSSPLTLKIRPLVLVAAGAEHAGVEQRVEQERGVARLGGDAGDARDVDVGALGAVDEVEVEDHRLAVAGEPGRQPALDVGEVERLVALGVDRPADLGARQRRHERLRHDPGHLHHRRLGDLGRQHAVGDQEHVGVEARALVAGRAPGRRCRRSTPSRRSAGSGRARRRRRAAGAGPGATATQNSSGVASSVPSTRARRHQPSQRRP